jgi:putative transposase
MMETFRQMVNECIRIGLEQNKTSMKSLSLVCYPMLKEYSILSYYKLCAISRASGILANYRKLAKKGRRVKHPHCIKPFLLDCYRLNLKDGILTMPSSISIPLNDYALKRLSQATEIRSVAVSSCTVNVCVSKEVQAIECTGMLGIDANLENVTMADSLGKVKRYEMKQVVRAKATYREIKRHFKRNDARVEQEIFGKYGKLQADKAQSEIHKISARIVRHAKKNRMGIALEDIKGIRKLYRKGNGQGRNYRSRLNSWSFSEFQRQIEYKARLNGLLCIKVNARGTSAKCSMCGDKMFPEENRMLRCHCGNYVDRDANASINIMKRGLEKLFSLRFKPVGPTSEAMVQEPSREVILKVDAGKLAS